MSGNLSVIACPENDRCDSRYRGKW